MYAPSKHIYISYSRMDSAFVDWLANELDLAGFDTWIDRSDIKGGAVFRNEIEIAIQEASHVVVVLSNDGLKSEFVNAEISYTQELNKPIILLTLGLAKIPPSLEKYPSIDFQNPSENAAIEQLRDFLLTPANNLTESQEIFAKSQQSAYTDGVEESQVETSGQIPQIFREIQADPSALNDRPTGPDRLAITKYARAFAQIVQNPDTATPLTIGLYAAWGMGKSFLMSKIMEEMDKQVTQKDEKKIDLHFVMFNAWVYSGSDHLWASLITHLYNEVEDHLG